MRTKLSRLIHEILFQEKDHRLCVVCYTEYDVAELARALRENAFSTIDNEYELERALNRLINARGFVFVHIYGEPISQSTDAGVYLKVDVPDRQQKEKGFAEFRVEEDDWA